MASLSGFVLAIAYVSLVRSASKSDKTLALPRQRPAAVDLLNVVVVLEIDKMAGMYRDGPFSEVHHALRGLIALSFGDGQELKVCMAYHGVIVKHELLRLTWSDAIFAKGAPVPYSFTRFSDDSYLQRPCF